MVKQHCSFIRFNLLFSSANPSHMSLLAEVTSLHDGQMHASMTCIAAMQARNPFTAWCSPTGLQSPRRCFIHVKVPSLSRTSASRILSRLDTNPPPSQQPIASILRHSVSELRMLLGILLCPVCTRKPLNPSPKRLSHARTRYPGSSGRAMRFGSLQEGVSEEFASGVRACGRDR